MAAAPQQPSTVLHYKDLFMQWSIKKKALFCAILLGIALLFIFALHTIREADYRLLYTNLDPEDYIALSDWLALRDIDFKYDQEQHAIYVAADRIHRTRLEMAGHQLPANLQNNDLIETRSLRFLDSATGRSPLIAVQQELSKTISSLDHIRSARVHLSFPPDTSSAGAKPAATVVLALTPGRILTSSQLQGLMHLLSASVSGLQPENIRIFDSSGSLLSNDAALQAADLFPDSTLSYRAAVERSLETKAQDLVDAMIGRGRALIRVAAEIDFARNETTSERYDPEEPVVRSEHQQRTPVDTLASGSDVDNLAERSSAVRNRAALTTSSKVDYEISKTTSTTIQPIGQVEQLSVTILVTDKKLIGKDGSVSFQPRGNEELDALRSLVTAGLSLKPERGDLVHLSRMSADLAPDEFDLAEVSALYEILSLVPVGSISLIAVIFVLFYFLLLKPLFDFLRTERNQFSAASEVTEEKTADDSGSAYERKDAALELKNEIASNPAAAAHIIKRWMKEA